MGIATKRKCLPEDNDTSAPAPIAKKPKRNEHALSPHSSPLATHVTPPSPEIGKTSSFPQRLSEVDAGSESDSSTSRSSIASLPSSSESNAKSSDEVPESDQDDSTSSSSSSSSSSGSSSSSDSTNVLTLPFPPKPSITRIPLSATTSDLHHRLSTFLPNLAAANDELEAERAAGTLGARNIETVDDQEYIEMNMGLGVLEEKELGREGTRGSGDDIDDDDGSLCEDDSDDEGVGVDGGGGHGLRAETDVLGRLLRRRKSKVDIQVIDAG